MKERLSGDLVGGITLLVLGAVFFVSSFNYDLGTMRRLGPAGFPLLASSLLMLLATAIVVGAIRGRKERVAPADVRGFACVFGGVLSFAILMPHLGLVPAVFASVYIASLASPVTGVRPGLVLAAAAAALCWLVFILGLGLPIPAFALM